MKLKFQAHSARVKGISFHPSKPWVITSLHSGQVQIWDYNMKICVAKFDAHQGPARGVDFHPQLPLFVTGGDDGLVKVWDYKQKRCMFTLKGHIDYIRSCFFHPQLPWIISACDDQTIRIWNYQSRACVNIITGHGHYVMCAQFHHEKNLIVSASLDSTVRIWDFSVLRKKLTQTKNASSFIGVQIQCIKVLDGHERGCNWVCFHPSQNMIASCSDDKKIKLWKYTNQVAWQHSTIQGHRNNISSVLFDGKSGALVSNSQDKTIRTWNYETKNQLQSQKRQKDRYWMLRLSKNNNLLCAGHDSGFQIWQMNKQTMTPHGLVGKDLLVFAQGMKTFLYDIEKNVQKQQLYQYVPKSKENSTFIGRIGVNKFDSTMFMVEIHEEQSKVYMTKKKQAYLNFPNLTRQYDALDSCFISKNEIAILVSPTEIHLQKVLGDNKKQVLRLSDKMKILILFNSNQESELIITTEDSVLKYDLKAGKVLGQLDVQKDADIRQVILSQQHIALCGKNIIYVTNQDLEVQCTITQKFSIKSAFWQRQNLLFYTTKNHWKYSFMNGETGVLKTLDQPMHLVRKMGDCKFLAFNQTKKIFEVQCPEYLDIQFKLAVQDKQWKSVDDMVKNKLGKQKKNLVSYLISKGLSASAVELAQTSEQKFALAIQASNFQLAYQICTKINTVEYWKLLGDQALKQGVFAAYEMSCNKLRQYDKLNFLYSLQNNKKNIQKVLKLAHKNQNPVLAFNSALLLGNDEDQQNVLRQCGLQSLAELAHEARNGELSDRLKALGSSELTPIEPEEQEPDTSDWLLLTEVQDE